MIRKIFLLFIANLAVSLFAQEPFYKTYNWEQNPDYKKLVTNSKEDIIAFKDKIIAEFYFTDENTLVEYFLEHQILWLNSDEKIEENNKVYLPYNADTEILANKARVISKDGKIKELDESKILTSKNDETNKTYRYFAFEGIEQGSFIEYYYIVKRIPQFKGKKIKLQDAYDKRNVEFDLYSPNNLVFKFKSYNGLLDVELDTLSKEKLHWKLHLDTLDKLEYEEKAPYNAIRKSLIYKLDRNITTNVYDISSYRNVAISLYKYLFLSLNKKEQASIDKLIKETGINNRDDDLSKIRNLENYLKKNIYISNTYGDQLEDIQLVIKNKTGDETGLLRLYIAAFKKLGIDVEIVLTSERSESIFDKDFEAGNFLTHYLLYFPSVKKYTSVINLESRIGFPPQDLTNNYGLFIKEVAVGDYKSGAGKIKYIPPTNVKESEDNLLINFTFDDEDFTISHIKLNRSYSGYYAVYIQPFLSIINKETLEELYNQLIKSISENITIKDKKILNDDPDLFGISPLKIEATIESSSFVDKAGKNYLFKLGELIGPQIEMYQEKDRQLPLESGFQRKYERQITVNIPKGYKINNLEKININNYYENEGDTLLAFHSYYKLEDQILTVYSNEYYKMNTIGLDIFEDYRKVINSAANFNKIVLVLEPEN